MPTPPRPRWTCSCSSQRRRFIENGHNLTDILKLLTDRSVPIHGCTFSDEVTAKFWADFEALNPAQQRQEVSSTINKFYSLLSDPRHPTASLASTQEGGAVGGLSGRRECLHVRLPVRRYGKAKVKLIGTLVDLLSHPAACWSGMTRVPMTSISMTRIFTPMTSVQSHVGQYGTLWAFDYGGDPA